ncbi:hypothetical protein GCM10010197_26400 [Nocardioides luteus]|uniref:ER-bound oxygenase mpaB/mpaB'/Rubber oxygenase catalytic domain-containing protein n=2 Tax=Nocardioides luteus TaxID=1844 RepID=A0ABQ5SWX5_9ACTN|nr:hypothetical protein GCM10010197_26400 [Nocardioides luteus]GLJ68662.1 hypothetical protein GCM10017579_26980 [Nocardioides luteus]
MVVRAMRQRAVGLTWGQRALVIGGLHPRLFVGTAQHTAHRATPYTRLALTARLMETVFLGAKEEADRALAFTARRHVPVEGTMEVDGGPAHPVGAHYSAADPGLMWWTAAFALDAVEFMYDALVRPLRPDEREELFEGFVTWAGLFGMPASAAPASYPDFRRRFDAWLASDEPHLVEEARLVGRHIAGTAGYYLPGGSATSATLRTVVQGSLPPLVRERYRIPWSDADEARWRAVRTASRLAHGRLSLLGATPVLRGRSEPFYKVVQKGEQALVRRGGVSIPGVSDVTPA